MNEQPDKAPEENVEISPGKQDLNKAAEKSADYQSAFRKIEYYYKAAAILNVIAITAAIWLGGWWWLLAIILVLTCIGILFYVFYRMRKKYLALSEQEREKYRQESQKYQQGLQKDIQKHQEHIQALESKGTIFVFPPAIKKIIFLIIGVAVLIATTLTIIYIDELRFSCFIELPVATQSDGSGVLLIPALWGIICCGLAIILFIFVPRIFKRLDKMVESSKRAPFFCLLFILLICLIHHFMPYIGSKILPILHEELFKTKLAKMMSSDGEEVQNIKKTAPLIYDVKFKNDEVFRVVLNESKNEILMYDRRFIPDPKEHKALIQVLEKNRIPQDLFYYKEKEVKEMIERKEGKGSSQKNLPDDKKSDKWLFKDVIFYYYEEEKIKPFIVRQKPNGEIYLVFSRQESSKTSAKE